MADMVGSAVVGETVNRLLSGLIGNHKDKLDGRDSMERLEMAHIKMEAALETSSRWQVTDVALLRWRKMLKRAADECDDALRRCKQRSMEEEEIQQAVRQSPFPRRFAHATKSFVSSFISWRDDKSSTSNSAVRRFEKFAQGASEFIKTVQFGRTPHQHMFSDPLIGHLLEGKILTYQTLRGSQFHYFGIRPMSFADRGLEVGVVFGYEDFKEPKKKFYLWLMLRLSESTDIVGVMVKCLQLVTPHFESTAKVVAKELTQLPTQEFSALSYVPRNDREHLNNIHDTLTQRFRPNPLCCKEHDLMPCSSKTDTLRLSNMFPEQVILVFLQCHISPLEQYCQGSATEHERSISVKDSPLLKLGIFFAPHDPAEALKPTIESSAMEIIDGEEQSITHMNVGLHQLDEMLVPKAIDYLCHKDEATVYEMSWKSAHGSAHLSMEKTSTRMPSARKTSRQFRNKTGSQLQDEKMKRLKQMTRELLKFWTVRASDRLRDAVMAWVS